MRVEGLELKLSGNVSVGRPRIWQTGIASRAVGTLAALLAPPVNEADASELDLIVTEANSIGDRVIAVFENRHDVPVGDVTIQTDLACFSADGSLLDIGFAPAGSPLVEPGGVTPGQFALPEASADLQTATCPVFLIAAQGGAGS